MDTYQTLFTLLCAFLLFKQILGQSCYTPDKQQGHCVPLNECPKVFNSFANPRKGSETYLRRFLCNDVKQLKVCCGTAANFTLWKDDPIPGSDILYRKAFNYCSQDSVSDIDLPLILFSVQPKKCFGILANPRYVITPAQCVEPHIQKQQLVSVVEVKFRGKNNNYPTFGVEEIIYHPFFDPVTGTNDIALLRLNQTISDDNVPAACVGLLDYPPIEESMLTYSNLALSTTEQRLNKTTVSIKSLPIKECEEDFQQNGAHVMLTEYDICIKNVKNVTKFTCNEFTGVPLFIDYGGGYVGFSSSRTVCNDGLPIIYTNVDEYKNWLIGQMKPWPIKNDPCTTPNGEIGECWYLLHCQALLDAFSSVTNATEAYLREFICEAEAVCCVMSSNSTIVLKKDEPKLDDVPITFLETRLCGMQHRDDYLSSSAAIAIDEFPWIALIELIGTASSFFACTGTLINLRYVISTGDCVTKVDMDTTIVRLGDYNRHNETSCVKDPDVDATDCTETEKYGIEDIILHPFFSPSPSLNDIGLLRLNKTVEYYTDYIRPICLPIPGTVTPKVGDTMYLSSWGGQYDGSKVGIKKKLLTQLISEEECQRQLSAHYIKHLNRICTLDYKNSTEFSDFLDVGGPLMFHNNYRWYIAGLILDTTRREFPTIYVNVMKYINWIIESMEPF